MKGMRLAFALSLGFGMPQPAVSQDVRIAEALPDVTFAVNGQSFTISRNQDQSATLTGDFAKTSRACPPFCVQPLVAAPGVETFGELETIGFLTDKVAAGEALLIDARLPEFYTVATIPGAVNVPFSTLDPANPYRKDILAALGATEVGDGFDFANAVDLLVFCNGPWSDQSQRAILSLVEAGYPSDRLHYYRGGLQDWLMLGLTIHIPGSNG